jgi:hypothetical protein
LVPKAVVVTVAGIVLVRSSFTSPTSLPLGWHAAPNKTGPAVIAGWLGSPAVAFSEKWGFELQ